MTNVVNAILMASMLSTDDPMASVWADVHHARTLRRISPALGLTMFAVDGLPHPDLTQAIELLVSVKEGRA